MLPDNYLYPAVLLRKALGTEKNPCGLCNKKLTKDDDVVELWTGSYKGNNSYTKRFCKKCFMKVILLNFPEMFDIEQFNDLKKEMLINKMEQK